MDRRVLAQDLRRWAVEEMGLPQKKAPTEEMLQRLFIGQCADIWRYVIRHMRSQRTVRLIEGNLLWYQQLQHSEAHRSAEEKEQRRRERLTQEILQLRSEVQNLQQQILNSEREVGRLELSHHKSQDINRRIMMLRAFHKKKLKECESLQDQNHQIRSGCNGLHHLGTVSHTEVVFPPLDETSAITTFPEPKVLTDVRENVQARFTFLRNLRDYMVAKPNQVAEMDLRLLVHHQWMSLTENVWELHPPNHVVSALEHLALEGTRDLRHLQLSLSGTPLEASDLHETAENLGPTTAKRPLIVDSRGEVSPVLPSFSDLLQDGWRESLNVWSELRNVQCQSQELSARMAEKVQEVHRALSDSSEVSVLNRAAFDAELRLVMLRGCRDGLLQECRSLQAEVAERKQEVHLLQKRQQNIQEACLILDRTQHQIQTLIQGNDIAKSEIRRHRLEAQKVVQESVRPRPHEVIQESERLHDSIMKDMKYFSSVCLPAVPKIYMDGVNLGPVQELSINRLSSPLSPYYPIYRGIYGSICLPPFKAPETALLQVSDIKKRLRFLRSQLSSRRQTIARLQRPLCETTDLDTLLQLLSGHYTQQMEQLVPKLQLLIQQCQQSQEYGKEVQAAVSDWWEQPAQMCLPQEERGGQTLRQWQDRWTVAVTALQRATDGHS